MLKWKKAYGLISALLVRGIEGNKSDVFSINNAWACQGRYSGISDVENSGEISFTSQIGPVTWNGWSKCE